MTSSTGPERDLEHAKLLLQEYSFDLSGFQAGELVAIWQERLQAEPSWIRAAVLEALYLGRYKAFSVEQILQGWKRRGHPVRHFNSEFERVVFGPIDPTISKYALMTTLSPSELMLPQSDVRKSEAAADYDEAAIAPPSFEIAKPDAAVDKPVAGETETESEPVATEEQSTPPDLVTTATVSTADGTDEFSTSESGEIAAQEDSAESAASLFSQPEPIQKFTPALEPEPSEFYQRLQAVARHAD